VYAGFIKGTNSVGVHSFHMCNTQPMYSSKNSVTVRYLSPRQSDLNSVILSQPMDYIYVDCSCKSTDINSLDHIQLVRD